MTNRWNSNGELNFDYYVDENDPGTVNESSAGTYVRLEPSDQTRANLKEYVDKLGLKNPAHHSSFHVSLLETPRPSENRTTDVSYTASPASYKFGIVHIKKTNKHKLILQLHNHTTIKARANKVMAQLGVGENLLKGEPHITLSHDYNPSAENHKVAKVGHPNFQIVLDKEVVERSKRY